MSGFNKFAMAVLLSLVVLKSGDIISRILINPVIKLPRNIQIVDLVDNAHDATKADDKSEVIPPIAELLDKANIDNGQKNARKCLQCHSFEQGGKHKNGPNLWNIVDAIIAMKDGFPYSKALNKKAKSGMKWTIENLNEFLYKPRSFAPGTKMSFAGFKKAQDRADMIAYLKTLR